MATAALLKKNKLKTALIVDDGYDAAPRLSDLGATNADWATFFDDLSAGDVDVLRNAYDRFDPDSDADYYRDETFLGCAWALRDKLNPEAVKHIFSHYETDQRVMGVKLKQIEKKLKYFGLKVSTAGREFAKLANNADLILIDLYLGSQHVSGDMQLSIDGLRSLIEKRKNDPPAIILMSSHPNVVSKRGEFRDKAGVYASGFRAINKADIDNDGRVDQLLFEIAQHRQDSLKLTNFLEIWQNGVQKAIEATSSDIRRLDLEDIVQLQDLMLDNEQVLRGSYMLDLVDRVLLHEVEAQLPTINAAKKLNVMDSNSYPPIQSTPRKTIFRSSKKRFMFIPTEEGWIPLLGIL